MTEAVGETPRVTWRRDALLVALVLLAFGPIVGRYGAQPASRYALTGALAEHGSVDVTPYKRILGVDRAVYGGELRSDKAPGQPLLSVPFYALGRAAGAESATEMRASRDLGLWWTTLWSAVVPLAALLVLMVRVVERNVRSHALVASGAVAFATFMLPHAVNLYGHVLAATFGYAAWAVLERDPRAPRTLALGGFLAATAVVVEYHAAIVAAVLFGFALLHARGRAAWFAAGALAPGLVLAGYEWAAFGAPWRLPFEYYAGTLAGSTEGGSSLPGFAGLNDVLVGNRGILIVSPIVFVALYGAFLLARDASSALRRHGAVAVAIAVPYLFLTAGWSGTPFLEEPGPRYAIPLLPFLAVPLAAVWQRARVLALLTTAWGALLMVPAAFTFILVGTDDNPIRAYLTRGVHGRFTETVWSMGLGWFGVVFHVASVAAVAAALFGARVAVDHERVFASGWRSR